MGTVLLPAEFGLETSRLNQLQLYSFAYLLGRNHPGTNALPARASAVTPAQREGELLLQNQRALQE